MKSTNSRRKIGTPYFSDRTTGINIQLPNEYIIYNYNRKIWFGGSKNGQQYMQIERVPTGNTQIPTILAEGDIDLFICTIAPTEQLSTQLRGVQIEGTLRGEDIKGYLAMIDINDNSSYLILMATKPELASEKEANDAISLATQLLNKKAIAA